MLSWGEHGKGFITSGPALYKDHTLPFFDKDNILNFLTFSLLAALLMSADNRAGKIRLSSDTIRITIHAIRYVSRYINTDTATRRRTIPVVYWLKVCTFFYSICKSFNNIFVTLFGKLTINLTFMLFTVFTCHCVVTSEACFNYILLRPANMKRAPSYWIYLSRSCVPCNYC